MKNFGSIAGERVVVFFLSAYVYVECSGWEQEEQEFDLTWKEREHT